MLLGVLVAFGMRGCQSAEPPTSKSTSITPPAHAQAGARPRARSPTRREVRVDGHPIAVWERRPRPTGPPVVLVHGRTWSALPDFDLQVPGERLSLMDALGERGYATYAVDLRGYGATPRDESGWLTPDRAARDLAAVLKWVAGRHRGQGEPAVLGWSMGSLVAHLCAQRHPELMSALVLFGYPRSPGWRVTRTADPARPAREPTTAKMAAEDFITPGTISRQAITSYVAAALQADRVRADWARLHEFNELDHSQVTVPVLVIHGARDPYAPVASQRGLLEQLGSPRKKLVTLPGLDHAAHLEDLELFVGHVVGFVEAAQAD